ncbi:alpha/beta fold hydrolase [Vibrio splendidus]
MAQDEEFERESFMAEFKFKGYNINVFHHDPRRIGKEWNGKTLLLLHGWEGRSVMFKPLIKQLTACGYRLVLPDLLAHGSSEGSRCSFYELADLIVEVDQRFGPFDTAVGHSFGGTALAIAIDQGMKIDKMITIGSPNGFGNMLNAYIDYYGYPAVLKSYLKDMYRRKNGRHPDDIGPTLWNRLTLPTLICHDSHDVVINVREAHAMHECFPNSELFISTGKGHRGVLKDTKLHQKIIEFI